MAKKFLMFGIYLLIIVVYYIGGLYFLQEKLYIFPDSKYISPKEAGAPSFKEVYIKADDGVLIRTWLSKGKEDKPFILFFHGNVAQNAEFALMMAQYLREGFGVMMMEYRGFGKAQGKFSQENIYMDAKSSFDYLKKNFSNRDIVVMGYSMGSAPASYLAFLREPQRVVLMAPFYSLKSVAGEKNIPLAEMLIKYEMPNYKFIKDYEGKLLIIHGDADSLILAHHGKKLYDLASKAIRQFILLKNIGHREIFFDIKRNGHNKIINWIYE